MLAVGALSVLFFASSAAAAPTPPFTQCPAIGQDTSCAVLIVVNPDGSVDAFNDPTQGPFDGIEDTLVGVQNNSSTAFTSVSLTGTFIFAFDGDGLCAGYTPGPSGCPFGSTGYEGPNTSFTVTDFDHGTVNFLNGGIPPGGSAYFSLEEAVVCQSLPNGGGINCNPPPPGADSLTLAPKTATNPVDTQHCVTATATASGNPVSSITVQFSVSGSVTASGSQTTDSNGEAQFCYTGPALPGSDAISAYADNNTSNTQDPGEPGDTASKTWTPPTSVSPCVIKITNGGWIVTDDGDRGSFGGNAKETSTGTDTGQEQYQDHGPAEPLNAHSLNVLAITCNSNLTQASIFGQATIDGTGSHYYRIDVQDNGEPGKLIDHYRIRLDTGYDSGDHVLRGGNVQIH